MRTLKTGPAKVLQRAAFCALVALGLAQPTFAAAPTGQMIAAYEAAPEDQRVMILVKLTKSGQPDLAETLLADYPLQGPFAANRTLFISGLILKAQGDLTGAAEKFRAALADDPSLTLVRSELAQTLVMLEEDDSAKHHLELLAAEAPSEQDASGIRSFIDKVDSRKPYKLNAYVALAPSTNLNSGSKHTTVYSPVFNANLAIDEENQAKSGIGAATGASAAYSKRMGNDFMFVAAGSADARIYDDKDFNSYSLSQSLELRRLIEKGYLGFGAVASQSLENDDFGVSYVSYGPRVSMSLNATAKDHLSATTVYEWRDTLSQHGVESAALMLDASWTHAFNATLNVTGFGGFDRIETKSALTSYQTYSGGLSAYHEFGLGITANVVGSIGVSDFDGYNALAGKTRADTKLSGAIELTKRDFNIFGFAPSLRYSYTENLSNINIFDYNTQAVDMRLTKDF
jgi:outer membrane protein